jgi:Tat protein secretion system quality control protein TatD with DNase activity
MFDIGVNLTSSQFAKDRDDVMARAQAAGVSGMLLTGTNLHESLQAQQLANTTRAAGPPPAYTRTTAVAGHRKRQIPSGNSPNSQKWWQ